MPTRRNPDHPKTGNPGVSPEDGNREVDQATKRDSNEPDNVRESPPGEVKTGPGADPHTRRRR